MTIMPKISLGTYLAHGQQLEKAVEYALKCGYRGFDTAKFYENERDLGMALKKHLPRFGLKSEDIFLTTKIFPYSKNTQKCLIADIEKSMQFLNRRYLDLVLIHYPRPFDNDNSDLKNIASRRELWNELETLKQVGLISSIGVSNYEIRHIEEMSKYSDEKPAVNQIEYHPHFQRKNLKNHCDKNGIIFQAFSPLGRQSKQLLEDENIAKIARNHNITNAQVILSWALQSGAYIVPKSVTEKRIEENFKISKLSLHEMNEINALDRECPYTEDNGWLCV
ncbi:unnamed protein product [Caenorhabditis bovis]|uniref:NADP-dependent oxidoreductase domain-containing protein n=1 Tax=Caenorhabditis bovis TaxID=2654633 RepID=A0A8S1F059_9PELO|nr:unnamed protein product [Caenorhabditis bovis]